MCMYVYEYDYEYAYMHMSMSMGMRTQDNVYKNECKHEYAYVRV